MSSQESSAVGQAELGFACAAENERRPRKNSWGKKRRIPAWSLGKLILSTSWVRVLGYEFTVQQLPPALRERVAGTIWRGELLEHPPRTRYDAIQTDAAGRGLARRLALGDGVEGWPEEQR